MSMLDRYRKPGGFQILLGLVETCGPTKQEKFLELIRSEDSRWADAIKAKMLDITRIYSWKDETLAEIIGTLQDLTLATALQAAPKEFQTRIFGIISQGRKRKIDDLLERNKPSAGEVQTMHMKIVETVRKMANDGFLRFEKFDVTLQMDDKFEENLLKSPVLTVVPTTNSSTDFLIQYEEKPSAEVAHVEPVPADVSPERTQEILALKKRVTDLSKENAVLRHELSLAKGKLDQIKKIA